jgi:DNA polymerase III subunit beta
MRVSVLQENLAKGLGIVSRAVDTRPTLPVLANVLLQTEDSRLKLVSTNLEMTITSWIGAKIDGEGAITLPAKTFNELVGNLSPERVDLSLDKSTLTVNVKCGATNSNVKGIDANEFPLAPEGSNQGIVVPGKVLKDMINQTSFAAAKEDNRPILTGLYTQFDRDVLTMAAADGYRLAVRTARLEQPYRGTIDMVIPVRALMEVARIISDDDDEVLITLPGDRDNVIFHMKNTDVASQLLQGKFPDFSAIIPKSYITSTVVYTTDLLRACKRAEIFARDSNNSAKIRIRPAQGAGEPGEVMIVGKSAERGDNEGFVDATVEGEAIEVAFNVRYLIDALNVMPDERVILESNGPANPGVIRPENREDFICVVMPMSVGR